MYLMENEYIAGRHIMEIFLIKLAVAVFPLFVLVASVIMTSKLSLSRTHHPLSWHRRRHSVLRTLAAGVRLH